ncbi:MAG: hypothetical protein ACR2QM_12170 [Longimicrobiales bacterium]
MRRLEGVISASIVVDHRGQVEEIHLLTSGLIPPKKTVRNVESALRAQFDLTVDHRKVSVAQTHGTGSQPTQAQPKPTQPQTGEPQHSQPAPPPSATKPSRPADKVNHGVIESPWGDGSSGIPPGPRLLFVRHRQERSRARKLRMSFELEWAGDRYVGTADALDLPRQRLEATAEATLRAVKEALAGIGRKISLELDGVEVVKALDHRYTLVSVHGMIEGRFSPLTGVVSLDDDEEQSVILATLRATERPVRIFLAQFLGGPEEGPEEEAKPERGPHGDPLRLWGGGS